MITLKDLAVYLEEAARFFSQYDYERLHQDLAARYEQQVMEAFYAHHSGWSIVQDNIACTMYLYRNWVFSKDAEENARCFLALAEDIVSNYEECEDDFLTEAMAEEVMKVAERVYHFSHHALRDNHMFIFLFRAKHRTEDSFCRWMQTTDGLVVADVYMLVPQKDQIATPQSVFLHELGHCVNVALTGNPTIVSADFQPVLSLLGLTDLGDDAHEFFAHCFAMSLLTEPELRNFDPFGVVPESHKKVFWVYFKMKMKNM